MNGVVQKIEPKEKLIENIALLVNEEAGNIPLIKFLNSFFYKKGLNIGYPTLIFDGTKAIDELNDEVMIVFCLGVQEYFKEIKKESGLIKEGLNPYRYYYSVKVEEIKLMQKEEKKLDPYIMLDEVIKISNKEYQAVVPVQEVCNWYSNNKIQYIRSIQRLSVIEELGNGIKIKKTNVNKKNIEDLKERYLNNDKFLATTEISLTCLMDNVKNYEFEFTPMYKNVGKLKFLPNFNALDDKYFPVGINDGFSRLSAALLALEQNSNLKRYFTVKIRLLNVAEARMLTADSFKQSATSEVLLQNYDQNPLNMFVDKVIEQVPYYNIIADTKEKEERGNFYASYMQIKETIRLLDIETKNQTKRELMAIRTGATIKEIIDYIKDEHFEGDILKMNKESNLLSMNSCIMYVYVAYTIKSGDPEAMIKAADYIYNNKDKFNKLFKYSLKSVDKILKEVKNIFSEVI